jgi:hypothetical protein
VAFRFLRVDRRVWKEEVNPFINEGFSLNRALLLDCCATFDIKQNKRLRHPGSVKAYKVWFHRRTGYFPNHLIKNNTISCKPTLKFVSIGTATFLIWKVKIKGEMSVRPSRV